MKPRFQHECNPFILDFGRRKKWPNQDCFAAQHRLTVERNEMPTRSKSRSPLRRDTRFTRSKSRSISPQRDRGERRPDKPRDHDRKKDDRKRSRSRSPRRHRSRSPRRRERGRDGGRDHDREKDREKERPSPQEASTVQKDAVDTEEESSMMQLMGFSSFDTTKGKRVAGQMEGSVKIEKAKKYRQYMNRRGGFNRPLDYVA